MSGEAVPPRGALTCSFVCTALHTSRLSHSEPPSATPSPALSVESLSSESSSQTPSGELLEPPVVPKSSSEPAVHAPGTPGTSASLSADSSLSSSGELVQPSVDQIPQASPGLAPGTRGSPGPQPAKPCSGAAPTPLLLVGDKSPAPSPGSSSPQLQVKVSAPLAKSCRPVWPQGRDVQGLPSLLASDFFTDLAVSPRTPFMTPFTTPFTEARVSLPILPSIYPPFHLPGPSYSDAPGHLFTCLSHVLAHPGPTPPATIHLRILLSTFLFTRPCLCRGPSHTLRVLRLLAGEPVSGSSFSR